MESPIALLVFRRPDHTARVFEAIRLVRPKTLFVVADGPRAGREDDEDRCRRTREVIERVDWPCEVLKNYSDVNLGCKMRVASGLSWVFDQVESAVVLEDDCLPHPTFFPFCEELLRRYADDERVMTVSGTDFQPAPRTPYSYYASRYMECWGWASWRRAWRQFDLSMSQWSALRNSGWLEEYLEDSRAAVYWRSIFDLVAQGEIDSWAYIWQYSIWTKRGLNLYPRRNLVANIGFGSDSTHTPDVGSRWAEIRAHAMEFPLRHPPLLERDPAADWFSQRHRYEETLTHKVLRRARRIRRQLFQARR